MAEWARTAARGSYAAVGHVRAALGGERQSAAQASAVTPHQLISALGLFNTGWYLEQYPDIAVAAVDPIDHYVQFGAFEGRDPNPLFDSDWYLKRNPDVAASGMNPLIHYIRYGAAEGRNPSALFNGELYRKWSPDIGPGANPLAHYLRQGRRTSSRPRSALSPAARAHGPFEDFYGATNNYMRTHSLRNPRLSPARTYSRGLSIIILNLNKPDLIIPLIADLKQVRDKYFQDGKFEVIIGDTGSSAPEVLTFYEELPSFVRVIRNLKYQFSRSNNDCFFGSVQYDKVLFLNNDVIIKDNPECIAHMAAAFVEDPQIGSVGLCLFYPSGALQHGGMDFFPAGDLKGFCYHPHATETLRMPRGKWRVPAVTGACLMTLSGLFADLGGFDEGYASEAQDVDLCLKLLKSGRSNVILNGGNVLHLENAARPKGDENWEDRKRFMRRWSSFIEATLL